MYTLFEISFLSNEMRQKYIFDVYDPEGGLRSSSGKALGYEPDGPGSIPGVGGMEIFFTPSRADWSWDPLSLL